MELYDATWEVLAVLPTVQQWPELQALLHRTIRNQPPHWRLPLQVCRAVGGTLEQALPAVAALGSIFLSIVLVDDILDNDPKGQHNQMGVGPVANMASALQAIGFEALVRSSLSLERQATLLCYLNRTVLQTTLGQYWDTQNPCDEESYWRVTRSKSSPFFAASFFMGAFVSGCPEDVALQMGEMGAIYGEMVQINDDLNDVMEVPANVDWLGGRFPLPILFATLVPHPEQARFLALRPQVGEEWALREAQEILIRCGAISYGVDQLLQRGQRLYELLDQTPVTRRSVIEEMVEGVLAPVQKLLLLANGVSSRENDPQPISV